MSEFKAPPRPDAILMDALPWRPGTRKYRIAEAIRDAHLPRREFRVLSTILWRNPKGIGVLASYCGSSSARQAAGTLRHLDDHGWLKPRRGEGWELDFGTDCECPPPLPRARRPGGYWVGAVPATPDGRTALYRLYDMAGVLLYVGITDDLRLRIQQHAGSKQWWLEVCRKTVAWYEDRDEADLAETLAIAAERPLHNVDKVYSPREAIEFDLEAANPPGHAAGPDRGQRIPDLTPADCPRSRSQRRRNRAALRPAIASDRA